MATHPENEEPGFEHDVNELTVDQGNRPDTLEDGDAGDESTEMEEAQEEAAEERKEGGYQ